MNIVRNDKTIKRNSRIAQFTMLGGLVVLAAGMFISFRYPEQFGISLGALMVGFLLSQVGIYFSNRWGRRPRPDELIDQALKGLDNKYSLYHYSTPVSHLLVGPAGIWILLPYYQRGKITFQNGRWKQKGGNAYLKIFAQESLGRPEMEVAGEMDSLKAYFSKILPEDISPEINVAMIFTNAKAEIDIPEGEMPPAETIPIVKLKELVRKTSKAKGLSLEKVKVIQDAILAS
ncbi:MAG TPA: hypothetical protein VLM80_09740 [Anaerolineales bacterium]|nr:hypothetical protein [Anaerolineales bacterium]